MNKMGTDDLKRALQNIDFKCVVCLDLLIAPVSLECGHTLCLMCCENLINRVCPTCRGNITSPSKNILLSDVLETIYGPDYALRCNKAETMKKYYGGERFDTLSDIITDSISNGELNPHDPNHKGIFITIESLIKTLILMRIDNIKYTIPEIKLCIHKLLKDKNIVQCKNYLLLNAKNWILEKILKFESDLTEQEILLMLSPIVKSSWNNQLGERLKKRRRMANTNFMNNIDEHEDQLFYMIRTKKIEL